MTVAEKLHELEQATRHAAYRSRAWHANYEAYTRLMTYTQCCRNCGQPFPEDDSRGREQGTANRHQPGACPECSCCVHYETEKKSIWQCADCATLYKAPKEKFNG